MRDRLPECMIPLWDLFSAQEGDWGTVLSRKDFYASHGFPLIVGPNPYTIDADISDEGVVVQEWYVRMYRSDERCIDPEEPIGDQVTRIAQAVASFIINEEEQVRPEELNPVIRDQTIKILMCTYISKPYME